jgi:membrane protease YdiL (CAAX protease family)
MSEEKNMSSLPDCLPPPLPTIPSAPIVPASTPATPRPPRTWYFFGSTIIALIAYAVQNLIGIATFILLFFLYGVAPNTPHEELIVLMKQGGWMALAIIAAAPFTIATLWVAIRIARQKFSDYLALVRPRRADLAKALAVTAVALLIWFVIGYLRGETAPAFSIQSYKTAKDAGQLDVFVLALCVAAPISEEFLVRGFLFRGWSQSFLGPRGAIVLSSAVWAALHTQYSMFYVAEIFTIGLLFGYFRHRSGSTWLTVVVHGCVNVISLIEVALVVAYS